MNDRNWIGYVRRDAKAVAELAAAAEAAMRSMEGDGGTALERAGVLRIVRMARDGATNAVEQLEAVARREWVESIGEPKRCLWSPLRKEVANHALLAHDPP